MRKKTLEVIIKEEKAYKSGKRYLVEIRKPEEIEEIPRVHDKVHESIIRRILGGIGRMPAGIFHAIATFIVTAILLSPIALAIFVIRDTLAVSLKDIALGLLILGAPAYFYLLIYSFGDEDKDKTDDDIITWAVVDDDDHRDRPS